MDMSWRFPVVVAVAVAYLAGTARCVEGEKMLFSFEREECEKAAQKPAQSGAKQISLEANFKAADDGSFRFFRLACLGQLHEREMVAIRPMLCVRENVSRGEYACRVTELFKAAEVPNITGYPLFRLPRVPVLALQQGEPAANLRRAELLNTSGWFAWAMPRDWSGWDALRIDVFLKRAAPGDLMLEVEDDLVEPPVSLTFEAPPTGKWVTLQMDLQ